MLVITVLGIAVAVNVILELRDPKIYNEGLIFFKVIHNSNLFLDAFAFPSQSLLSMYFLSTIWRFWWGNMHSSVNTCSAATCSLMPLWTPPGSIRTSFVFCQYFAYI